jgi:hypothetical protein
LSGAEELGLRLLVLVEFDGVPPMLPLPIGPVDVDGICEPLGVVGVLLDPVDVVGGVSLPIAPGVPRARIRARGTPAFSGLFFLAHVLVVFVRLGDRSRHRDYCIRCGREFNPNRCVITGLVAAAAVLVDTGSAQPFGGDAI